jgi:outer membrane receptor protein involved in Fe transport
VPDLIAVTYGARFYDVETDLKGSARGGSSAKDNNGDGVLPDPDLNPPNNNLTTLFSAAGPGPDKAESDGVISKVSVSYTPAEDLLYYVTYSEGFRPGVLNRPGGTVSGNYTVPYAVDTDEITNYEFGWKYTAPNGRMRFNGSAFYVDIERLQTTIFDPSITNLFFSENAANAELMGLEGDFTYLPESVQGLTLTGAFSLLDTEVTEVLVPTNDVKKGSSLAYAPELQFNIRARYEWEMGNGMTGHIMPAVIYSDEQYSDIISINRDRIDSSTVVNLSVGITAEAWSGEVYIDNLTDEYAETARNFVNDRERVTPMRPMTLGVRLSRDF